MLRIDIQIEIITYLEDNVYIVFSPELDLSGYDTTLEKAHESFKIVVDEYFKHTIEKGTLIQDLKKHGWTYKNLKLKRPTKQKLKSKLKHLPKTYNELQQNYQINFA